jgi:hypothetical protein
MVQKRNGLQEKSYGPRKVMVSTKKLWFPEKLWSQKSYGLHIKSYGLQKAMVFSTYTEKLWSFSEPPKSYGLIEKLWSQSITKAMEKPWLKLSDIYHYHYHYHYHYQKSYRNTLQNASEWLRMGFCGLSDKATVCMIKTALWLLWRFG